MNRAPKITAAQVLLNLLRTQQRDSQPTDAMVETAIVNFLNDVATLDQRHNRQKVLSQDQLAEQIFRSSPTFKDERAVTPYLRYHLRVAHEELKALVDELRSNNNGVFTATDLLKYKDIFVEYLHGLREIFSFLQRNDPDWQFFEGIKNSNVTSWEVYLLAKGLAYHSTYTGTGPHLETKAAQIASIFVLRQAMELRFERLIAVYPTDSNGKAPKLKHGFHQDFISSNQQFFKADGFEVKKLRHLYDWCSDIVHQAYQPFPWQISMALRRGGSLLRSRSAPENESWSIFNAVRIDDVEAMQTAYEEHFLATYGHGTWRFTRGKPEALVPSWQPEMYRTSDDYRPVANPRN